MTILKVTKNQDFTLSLENAVLEKQFEGGQIDPSPAFQGLGTVKWLKRCTCHDRHISKTIPSISW